MLTTFAFIKTSIYRFNVKKKNEMKEADRVNNFGVIGIFLVTLINVFLSTFSGSPAGAKDAAASVITTTAAANDVMMATTTAATTTAIAELLAASRGDENDVGGDALVYT